MKTGYNKVRSLTCWFTVGLVLTSLARLIVGSSGAGLAVT